MKRFVASMPPGAVYAVCTGLLLAAAAWYGCKHSHAAARLPGKVAPVVAYDTRLPEPAPSPSPDVAADVCPPGCECGCAEGQPCLCAWQHSKARREFLERWHLVAYQNEQLPRRYDPDALRRDAFDRQQQATPAPALQYCDPVSGQCFAGGSCGSSCAAGSCSSAAQGGGRRAGGRIFGGRRGGRRGGSCCN